MRLITCFSEIFAYVLRLKESHFYGASHPDVLTQLRAQFDRAKTKALTVAPASQYDDCLYACCAWIDELILCSTWDGRFDWKHSLLQQEYFKTASAGHGFYDHLDALTASDSEVAEVYYYCLSLGFTGRYYHSHDRAILLEKLGKCYSKAILGYNTSVDENLSGITLFSKAEPLQSKSSSHAGVVRRKRMIKWGLVALPLLPLFVVGSVFYGVFQSTVMEYIRFLQ